MTRDRSSAGTRAPWIILVVVVFGAGAIAAGSWILNRNATEVDIGSEGRAPDLEKFCSLAVESPAVEILAKANGDDPAQADFASSFFGGVEHYAPPELLDETAVVAGALDDDGGPSPRSDEVRSAAEAIDDYARDHCDPEGSRPKG